MSFKDFITEKKGSKRKLKYRFGVPAKYLAGLSDEEAKKRAAAIKKRGDEYEVGKKKIKDDDLPGDQPDTKDSPSTKRYHAKYGKPESLKKKKKSKKKTENQEMTGSILMEVVNELLEEEDKKKFISKVARDTGISASILSQVYSRGMAAARSSGNRPGANPVSWAKGRVYSFVENDRKHDKDLHAKRRDSKKPKWAGGGQKKSDSKKKKKSTKEGYATEIDSPYDTMAPRDDTMADADLVADDRVQLLAMDLAPLYRKEGKDGVLARLADLGIAKSIMYPVLSYIKKLAELDDSELDHMKRDRLGVKRRGDRLYKKDTDRPMGFGDDSFEGYSKK